MNNKRFYRNSVIFLLCLLLSVSVMVSPVSAPIYAQQATSEKCITKVGEPTEPSPGPLGCSKSGGAPGVCGEAPEVTFTTAEEYADAIADKWNIGILLPLEQMQYAWEEFHEIDCLGILQDIEGSVIQSWGESWSEQKSCPGDPAVDLYIGQHYGGDWVKALLLHELTHIWQFCSTRGEANVLENADAVEQEGYITKYSRGECPDFKPGRPNYEDHADNIALFYNPETGELTCGNGDPNPFASGGFPVHRTVAENAKD